MCFSFLFTDFLRHCQIGYFSLSNCYCFCHRFRDGGLRVFFPPREHSGTSTHFPLFMFIFSFDNVSALRKHTSASLYIYGREWKSTLCKEHRPSEQAIDGSASIELRCAASCAASCPAGGRRIRACHARSTEIPRSRCGAGRGPTFPASK